MKKILSVLCTIIMAVVLVMSVGTSAYAAGGTISTVEVSATTDSVQVSGTTSAVNAAVCVQLMDGDEIIAMASFPVDGGSFSGTIDNLSLTDGSTYKIKVADYDGGSWKEQDFTAATTAASFTVSLYSSTADGGATSIAKLSQDDTSYGKGDETTIVAEAKPGFEFAGWYEVTSLTESAGTVSNIKYGSTPIATDLAFVYTVGSKNASFVAIYEPNKTMKVTVKDSKATQSEKVDSYKVGSTVTVTSASDDGFAYWANEAGAILCTTSEYTFTVSGAAIVEAVYNTAEASKSIVNFISGYNQIIQRGQYGSEDEITVPQGPVKSDYNFIGWSVNDSDTKTTNQDVKNAIQTLIGTGTEVINVTAKYEVITRKVHINVECAYPGNGTPISNNYVNINDIVTVKASDAHLSSDNYIFSHWEDENGNVLCYNENYSFFAMKDVTVTAVFGNVGVEIETKGTTQIISTDQDSENGRLTFVSMSTVPEGCKILKAGVIATADKAVAQSKFDDTNALFVRGNATDMLAYRYTWTINGVGTRTVYVRAYLVYIDKNGSVQTVYGDVVSNKLN